MIKIQIKSIFGKLLFEYEKEENTIKETLIEASRQGADLEGADLRSANLRSADLRSADLRNADLRSADLRSADLRSADLRSANLRSADLEGANLYGANLRSADLRSADLRSADLRSANLEGANLEGADLEGADLRSAEGIIGTEWHAQCMQQILYVLSYSPKKEIENLKKKLLAGEVDGTQYEGECCCLVGTLGGGEDEKIEEFCSHIPYYTKGLHNVGEQLFYQIREGDKDTDFVKEAIKCCDITLGIK